LADPKQDAKPEPISMGILINFTKRTVQGFGYPAKITDFNDVTVDFGSVLHQPSHVLGHRRRGGDHHSVERIHALRAEMQASTTDVLRSLWQIVFGCWWFFQNRFRVQGLMAIPKG
jgi:hypothetical protein